MTRRDWWFGILCLVVGLLLHAALPRYDWRQVSAQGFVRIDHWTGTAEVGTFNAAGTWASRSR